MDWAKLVASAIALMVLTIAIVTAIPGEQGLAFMLPIGYLAGALAVIIAWKGS